MFKIFNLIITTKHQLNKLQIQEYSKGFTEGQLSVVKSNMDGTKAFILGNAPDKKLIRDVNDILNKYGF